MGKEATPTREDFGGPRNQGIPVFPLKHGGEGRRLPEGTVVMTISSRRLSRRTWLGGGLCRAWTILPSPVRMSPVMMNDFIVSRLDLLVSRLDLILVLSWEDK